MSGQTCHTSSGIRASVVVTALPGWNAVGWRSSGQPFSSTERAELAVRKGLTWLGKPYGMETLARIVERALRGDGE